MKTSNAKPVSQLAGEIAAQLSNNPAVGVTAIMTIEDAAKIISAALSDREEKVAELLVTGKAVLTWLEEDNGDCALDNCHCTIAKFRRALSALGEPK